MNTINTFLSSLGIFCALTLTASCEMTQRSGDAQPPGDVKASYLPSAAAPLKSQADERVFAQDLLSNGIRVLAVQDANAAESAISVTVDAGSFQNPPEFPGLAHYLEHMLFLGTKKYPTPDALVSFIDENAGRWNAYTASDHTNYFFSIAAPKMSKALDYFSDYFRAPLLDPVYSDKERNAVNSEWSIGREQDAYILSRLLYLTANPEHPGQALTVGNLETLKNDKDDSLNTAMREFFDRYYDPSLMTLAIVGPQDVESLLAMVRDNFSDIETDDASPPDVLPQGLTEQQLGMAIYYEPKQAGQQLFVEFPIANRKSEYLDKSYQYISNILSSEEPGSPGRILREAGLINSLSAGASQDAFGADGLYRISVDLTKQGAQTTEKILQTVFSYLRLVEQRGVNEDYYEEFRAILNKRFETQEQSNPLSTAYSLTPKMRDIPAKDILSAGYLYQRYNPEFIRQTLAGFTPENSRIWYIMPHSKPTTEVPFYAASYATEKLWDDKIARLTQAPQGIKLALPAKNDLFSKDKASIVDAKFSKPTLIRDQAHQKVWLTHAEDHRNEKGFFHAQLNSGLGEQSLSNKLSFMLLQTILQEEILSLSDKASRAGLQLRVVSDPGSMIAFDISGDTQKHQRLAKQTLALFTNLELDEKKVSRAKEKLEQDLKNLAQKRPFRQAYALFSTVTQEPSYTADEMLTLLPSVGLKDVALFNALYKKQHMLHVFAFGNYTEQDAIAIADAFKLPSASNTTLFKNGLIDIEQGGRLLVEQAIEQTDNVLLQSFVVPSESFKDRAAVNITSGFARIAFFTQLRSKEQLGYAVTISPTRVGRHPGLVMLVQSDHKSLLYLEKRFDQFRKEYAEEFLAIDQEKFSDLQQSQLSQLLEPASNFGEEASRYLDDFVTLNFDYDSREKRINALKALTLEEVKTLYQDLLLSDSAHLIELRLQGTSAGISN